MSNNYILRIHQYGDHLMSFPVRPCSFDGETRGVKLRTIDLAVMLYVERHWEITVTPHLPVGCVWVSVLAPGILAMWRAWNGTNSKKARQGDECGAGDNEGGRDSGEETDEEEEGGEGGCDDEYGAWGAVEEEEEGAVYFMAAANMWAFAVHKLAPDHIKYMSAGMNALRSDYNWHRGNRDMLKDLIFERRTMGAGKAQSGHNEAEDDDVDTEILTMMQRVADINEQMMAIDHEIDRIRDTVTRSLDLHPLLLLGTVYPDEAVLPYETYVTWL